MNKPQHQLIRVFSSAAAVSIGTYKGEEHLIVPFVVMVGDSVVRPMGSEGPEFIPSDVLSFAPDIWNDTAVILDHPNGASSACDPVTLERFEFGRAFNSRFKNNALQVDLWLSPSRAKEVGPEAENVITKCRAGEVVEVSFAPYMVVEPEQGISPKGVPYEYRCVAIVGKDHIAALPEGTVGACSVAMGCGGPRAMKRVEGEVMLSDKQQSLYERVLGMFSSLLKSELIGGETETTAEDGKTAATVFTAPAADVVDHAGAENGCECSRKELAAMSDKKKNLVSKLMACGKFKQAGLEAMSEEALEGLAGAVDETGAAAADTTTAPVATPTTTATATAPVTRDQALGALGMTEDQWAAMQNAATTYQTQVAVHKSALISRLAVSQTQFSQADLDSMDVKVLDKLDKSLQAAAGQADYSFSRVGVQPNSATKDTYTPPDPHNVNKYLYPKEN